MNKKYYIYIKKNEKKKKRKIVVNITNCHIIDYFEIVPSNVYIYYPYIYFCLIIYNMFKPDYRRGH